MGLRFTKMHGIGNDYVYVDCFSQRVDAPEKLAIRVSDRHFGIGSDGLILILPSEIADVKMRMFNADGSEGEMCGNGIRCLAKFAFERGLARKNPMRVETGRGVLTLALELAGEKVSAVTVNMGRPSWELEDIPVNRELVRQDCENEAYDIFDSRQQVLARATFIAVGNPHAVVFVDDVAAIEVEKLGPILEHHRAFPKRMNIHWAQVIARNEIRMRTWERGSGVTLACGTGASAVCVAGSIRGLTDDKVLIHLPGGDLNIEWREDDDCVYMTGPATEVFTGELPTSDY